MIKQKFQSGMGWGQVIDLFLNTVANIGKVMAVRYNDGSFMILIKLRIFFNPKMVMYL